MEIYKMKKDELVDYLERILNSIKKTDEYVDNVYNFCNIDIIDTPIFEETSKRVDLIFELICKSVSKTKKEYEVKFDTISWFFYEYFKPDREMTKENAMMWDKNMTPLCYDLDSLADYLLEKINFN